MQAVELLGCEGPLLPRLRALLQQARVAQVRHEAAHELLGVGAAVEGGLEQLERPGGVALRHEVDQVEQRFATHHSQQVEGIGHVHAPAAEGGDLVEQAQGVAVRAIRGTRHQVERLRGGLDVLLARHALENREQVGHARLAQGVGLQARPDGGEDVPRVRGAEDHHQLRRRLLEGLQQGAGRALLDLVRLVHDGHAVARGHRRVPHALEPVAHLIDAARARCCVDLHHVQPVIPADAQARVALAAGRGSGPRECLAVQAPGKDARGRGLARSARTREQEAVGDRAALECVRERARHVLLADEILEAAGPMAVVEALSGVCHEEGGVTVHPPSNTCREVVPGDATPAREPHCA